MLASPPLAWLRILRFALFALGLAPLSATAEPIPDEALVVLGPDDEIENQFRYIAGSWPWQHAVVVATLIAKPSCRLDVPETEGGVPTTYCWAEALVEETILVSWIGQGVPVGEISLHYWVKGAGTRLLPKIDESLVLFLAPTVHQVPDFIYSTTMILPDDEATRKALNRALWQSRGIEVQD